MPLTSKALNARVIGEAGDVLVLAHGFGSDQDVWRGYVSWLSQRYRVLLYDLACAGSADPHFFDVARHQSLQGHADDLLDVLRELSIERCTFVGHSVSGMIGVLAAIERPKLFQRLILLGASARYVDDEGYRGGFDHATVGAVLDAIRMNYRGWAETFGPFAVSHPLEDPASQTFVGSILRMRPDEAVVMAKAIFLSDYRAVLPRCAVPAVVLQTRHDPAVPLEAAQYLHHHLHGSRFDLLDADGHLPHLSAPAEVSAALRRHLHNCER